MTKKWNDVRRTKVPADQEPAVAAGVRALRDALALSQIRTSKGLTQAELAERLGKSQGNVSELERREDVYLSSLREYIEALGGQLEVSAVFDDERTPVLIDIGAAVDRAASELRAAHDALERGKTAPAPARGVARTT